jgi:CheY-like chemotaxis protein
MVQAMQRDPLPDGQRERLAVIGQSGETLLTILNDILDLSKIEAGKLDLEDAEFDLRALALAAQDTFRLMAEDKGLDFALEVDAAALGTYRGDQVRVRQILYNLISNAVKFTSAGAITARIERVEGGVRFSVTDTGIGMSPDQIDRLFDKFVQADSSTTRRFGGTGLGLAICRELCLAMGGAITAKSEIGAGSCFVVDLPLVRLAGAGRLASRENPPPAVLEQRQLRILAAEDNSVNQLVLKTLLGQAGFEPVVVADGEAAVAAWEEGEWDVILMDVRMPVMDGPAATRLIRRRESETGRRPTPIIALTANAMTHHIDSYVAAGMNAFVSKPIEIRQLFEAITAAIQDEGEPASAVA